MFCGNRFKKTIKLKYQDIGQRDMYVRRFDALKHGDTGFVANKNRTQMKYNKENGRKNMRLQGYDYSRAGLYFLTIVIQKRLHLFGHIQNGEMILNDAGRMMEKWYYEIENKYPDKRCHEMVVMPNHFHCIIENTEIMDAHATMDAHVGASIRGRPYPNDGVHPISNRDDNKYGLQNKKIRNNHWRCYGLVQNHDHQ